MTRRSIRHERRGRDRPTVGAWKPCPNCPAGMLLFSEHYPTPDADASSTVAMPAWVCDHCAAVMFVRAEHQPSVVRQTARDLRAKAKRSLMKARFVRHRADRALKKSLSRKSPRG